MHGIIVVCLILCAVFQDNYGSPRHVIGIKPLGFDVLYKTVFFEWKIYLCHKSYCWKCKKFRWRKVYSVFLKKMCFFHISTIIKLWTSQSIMNVRSAEVSNSSKDRSRHRSHPRSKFCITDGSIKVVLNLVIHAWINGVDGLPHNTLAVNNHTIQVQ